MLSTKNRKTRSGPSEYEARWERAAGPNLVGDLDGDWRVERLAGPLPMLLLRKRIENGRGTTRVSLFGPGAPFELEQRGDHVALIYKAPLSFLVDELRREPNGSWLGRAKAAGLQYAWFRLAPVRGARGR